jgi:hypothetical protein
MIDEIDERGNKISQFYQQLQLLSALLPVNNMKLEKESGCMVVGDLPLDFIDRSFSEVQLHGRK